MPVMQCNGLTKRYAGKTAVDDLTLSVHAGEIFGLLGPNGAGKTTTFRLLLGLSHPDAGTATLLSSVGTPTKAVLARVGAVIEEPSFYPWMTGETFLSTVGETVFHARNRFDGLLEEVGLRDARHLRIRQYSQGMRQRLALAAALLHEPDLLILDEPMNGLDPAGMSWLRELLAGLAERGTTVILSSHQLGEVERLCHRVGVLDHGRLVDLATTAEISATSDRVRVIIAESDRASALGALAGYDTCDDAGAILVTGATVPAVIAALASIGVYPESVERERTSLEQRFLKVTGVT
jgi:ABC-2 type transport system ATP-binding protein